MEENIQRGVGSMKVYHALDYFPGSFSPLSCDGNFIDDGNRIRILDWEYAGMGDIFFDLGNFAIQHEFNDEQDELLLRAYFNTPTDSQRAHQKLMKIVSDLREVMWAQVQIGVSKLDFDYAGYGKKYFERFETSTNSSEYTDWLGAA